MSAAGASRPGPATPLGELEVDDRFWREVLAALRTRDGRAGLEARYPSYAATLEELGRQAREDAALIGVRFDGEGGNARLLGFLTTALLARAGLRGVFVDLSPDLRWLERLTGLDLKQGLVDHVHYGVPLERCVRDTAMPGLAVLTGGTRFLTGSPLEDAPAVRGALDRLKQHFRVVVAMLPSSEPVSEAGIVALCDALLTVRAEEAGLELLGRERLVARLVGDPEAAHDLAAAAHRFVGPIPELVADAPVVREEPSRPPVTVATPEDAGRRRAPVPAARHETEEDVAFLSLFEESRAETAPADDPDDLFGPTDFSEEGRSAVAREWPARRRRKALASLGVAAVLVGGMILGTRFLPDLGLTAAIDPSGGEDVGFGIDRRPIGFEEVSAGPESGAVVSLEEEPATEPVVAAPATPAGQPGRPAPYSLHVGSFQSERSAVETARRLERAGWTAFVAPVALDERGSWHRVYAGAFADSSAAGSALRRLLEEGLVPDGAVRATPLTFFLGTYPSREEAERRRAELRERGIPAYVSGSGPARVYAGAYSTAEESRLLEGSLHAAAEKATLTTRIES